MRPGQRRKLRVSLRNVAFVRWTGILRRPLLLEGQPSSHSPIFLVIFCPKYVLFHGGGRFRLSFEFLKVVCRIEL